MGRNNDLILQFGTPWVGEEVLLNRFADILFVCVLVIFLVLTRLSTDSFSIPLVIPQTWKIDWFCPNFGANHSPLYEDFFDDLGIDWLLFFQEKTEKIKFGIFETSKWYIFNHIGSAQRHFWLYFPYYLPIRKYAWKMPQNHFFCKFSKTSEKFAFWQKNLGGYPGNHARCRYRRKKVVKTVQQRKI